MYAMVCTRPDLAYALSIFSRFMSNPGKAHWQALKLVLRYVKGTLGYGLIFGGVQQEGKEGGVTNHALIGFTDSDYAKCLDSRKSTSGYCFTLYGSIVYSLRRIAFIVITS